MPLYLAMDPRQEGIVNTCFLTVRLPTWAGSRQNVSGSDINGTPVRSKTIDGRGATISEDGGIYRGVVDVDLAPFARLEAQVLEFNKTMKDLSDKITELETKVAELTQNQ